MIVIKPDHSRRVDIAGVPAPVRRPVDIDQSKTGFTSLRTLRIYQFERESVIEGHAEEDEVFVIVIAGSVELTMSDGPSHLEPVTLSAPDGTDARACAAYLPPGGAYKLVAKSDADVAYARATPSGTRPAKIFCTLAKEFANGFRVLLKETAYAERLRLRLVQFDARQGHIAFGACEGLIHIRIPRAERVAVADGSQVSPAWLDSWDTVVAMPNDNVTLEIAEGLPGLALIVMAVLT